jgi:hypothetical protein
MLRTTSCLLALALALITAEQDSRADDPPAPLPDLVLTQGAIKGLKEFQSKVGSTGHGYLAVSPDGVNWAYWLCRETNCSGQRAQDKSKALDDCRDNNYGVDCVILAQDQTVVLEYLGPPDPKRPKPQMAASHPPAPPAKQIATKGRPGWTVDALHGCWIWNRKPVLENFITWSGACAPDGPAIGPGLLDWGDERFYGEMKDGRKFGKGLLIDEWGGHARGTWKNGLIDGQVVYVWDDGSHYEGPFAGGYPNGHGIFTDKGKIYEGEWKNGCLVDKRLDWSIYGEANCK